MVNAYRSGRGSVTVRSTYDVEEFRGRKQLVFTEGTNEGFTREKYQHWPNAERYGGENVTGDRPGGHDRHF